MHNFCNSSVILTIKIIARLEDEVTLKYFKQTNHNLELIPANKDFSTIEIDLREQEAFVEGKSVGLIRTH